MGNTKNPIDHIKRKGLHGIWLISDKVGPDASDEVTVGRKFGDQVIEYRISDFAKYLINPNPIEVVNTLVGCKIFRHKPAASQFKYLMRKYFKKCINKNVDAVYAHEETYLSELIHLQDSEDPDLQMHINKMKELLIPYDTIVEKISGLDTDKILDATAIVEDPEDNRSHVVLKGTVDEKIQFILNNVQKKVGVVLKSSCLDNGLFDMRGFDFESFDPKKNSRLRVVFNNDQPEAHVLTPAGKVEFNVSDIELVKCIIFLQMSLKTNEKIKHLFGECIKGAVKPLKLMLNKKLEIDYFQTDLPNIYQEVFEANNISKTAKDIILKALNQKQVGILISYLPKTSHGKYRSETSVYVMHDIKALEPIKAILPQLYSEIDKKIGALEKDKYYLMDSMKGYNNAK